MSLSQRSKSAPQLTLLIPPSQVWDARHYLYNTQPKRKNSFNFDQYKAGPSPLVSPVAAKREDAFSLGGFFPSPLTEDDQEWNWLRVEETDSIEEGELSDTDSTAPSTPTIDVDQVIQNEDKMGILTLTHLLERMNTNAIATDIQLMYTEDTIVDSPDSLCDRLRARRQASEGVQTKEMVANLSTGGLFSPIEQKVEYTAGWRTLVTGMFL